MQKFTRFIGAFLLLLFAGVLNAQTNIANYTYSQATSTFTPLSFDTAVFTGSYDDTVTNAISIGGGFTFGGVSYSQCYISSNGFITFGAAPATTNYTALSTLGSTTGAIAAFAVDGASSTIAGVTSRVSYASIGNEFIVQYLDHATYGGRSAERVNFQIRLNKTTNTVSFVYGTFTAPGSAYTAQVGIRGASTAWATNVNNLLLPNIPAGTSCNWSNAVTGNANSSTLLYSTANTSVVPPVNLMYTWTPATSPAPVRTFYAVSNLLATSASIKWAPATGAATYNVQYRTLGSCSWTNFNGNPVADTSATLTGLTPVTTYQIRVQTVGASGNAIWSHIPTSAGGTGTNGYVAAGTFTTTALCTAPTAVTVSSITVNSASISFTGSGSFIVEYGLAGFTPGTGATAGTGGAIVSGTASPISISGLTSGTTYDVYVRQNCTGTSNGYSTNSTKATFSTACTAGTIPYSENFDAVTAPNLPPCILIENVNGATTWAVNASTFTGYSAPNVMRYNYSSTTAADDWFFVKGLNLTAGTAYNIAFKYAGTGFVEKLEVRVGSSATAASAATGSQIFNNANITTVGNGIGTFTPATTGTYYFGFHAYSDADQFNLYVDDINITVAPACAVPTSASIGSITSNSAAVNFTSSGNNFIAEYSTSNFTPGMGAAAGTGGTVVTGTSSPISLTGLAAATTYYVYLRQNCTASGNGYSANVLVDSFITQAVPPINDSATGAITLTVGAGCTGAIYTNAGATLSAGEPFPSCSGTAQTPVWFKFVAPVSGAVRVSTDVGSGNTFTDSKVALFSATNPANYSTFSIISCDDDGGSVLGSGFMSVLYATGLTSGTTYYIAVDKYASSTTNGIFCIAVSSIDTSMISRTNTCGSTFQTPVSSGTVTTYTGWVPLLDASSKVIALVQNPAGGSSSSYTVNQNVNSGAVRNSQGTYYLDRNFRISNSASATNVNVQLFFLNSELNALQTVDPLITLANIGVTRQTERTAGCSNNFDTSRGPISFIAQTGNATTGMVSWINFMTPGFSNFYLNRNGTSLPIKFEYLTGKKAGSSNALNWKVTCTSTSITMVLERSADARSFNTVVTTINATQARCGQPFDAVDATPVNGISYYRLKMIDVDGKVSYSPVAAVLNGKVGAELVGVYPTVVKDLAYLSITSSRNTTMQFSISDMSGKVIKTITQAVNSGSSLLPVNTSSLASGVYNITGLLDGVRTQTLRFVKQ